MIHHHVLDILRGRISPSGVIVSQRLDRRAMARIIREAEVFDFGEIVLEAKQQTLTTGDGKSSVIWAVPQLTDDEDEFWEAGLIPMPSERAWFEFVLNGHASAILVEGRSPIIKVMRFDYDPEPQTGVFTGCTIHHLAHHTNVVDYSQAIPGLSDYHQRNKQEGVAEFANLFIVMYFLLMINSKSTERERVSPPPDPALRSRNRHQLPEHTVVRIIPRAVMAEMRRTSGGSGHASPRLHWRRSHLREYRAPSGEVYHRVVVPRCLVGLASKDTVTHTYKVTI